MAACLDRPLVRGERRRRDASLPHARGGRLLPRAGRLRRPRVPLGGGCGLVACADVAIAPPRAVFGFTEVRLGIIPAVISPFVLPKIGEAARRYFLTGERFGADVALRIGLVQRVAEDTGAAAEVVVENLLAGGPEPSAKRSVSCASALAGTRSGDRRRSTHERRGPGRPAGIPRQAVPRAGSSAWRFEKLLVANRGEIAVASSAPRVSSDRDGRGRRARRPRLAPCSRGGRGGRDRELPPLRGAHPRSQGEGRGRDPPRLRLPRRERRLRRGGRGGGADLGRAPPRRSVSAATRSPRSGSPGRPEFRRCPRGGLTRSASRSSSRPRREAADGGCASFGTGRSSTRRSPPPSARRKAPSATGRSTSSATSSVRVTSRSSFSRTRMARSSRSASATARCSAGTRRFSRRHPRPRLTPSPAGGARRGRGRVRPGDRLPERGHRRVRRRGRRLLLPRAQRAHPGRAPGDGGGDRARSRRRADTRCERRAPRG